MDFCEPVKTKKSKRIISRKTEDSKLETSLKDQSKERLKNHRNFYCNLSLSYTSELDSQSSDFLKNLKSSMIDLNCDIKLCLESRSKDSVLSQQVSNNSACQNDQLAKLIQSMNESMRDLKIKLEKVDLKYNRSEEDANSLKRSILELNEKVLEMKQGSYCACPKTCQVM